MPKLLSFLKNNIFVFLLISISVFLCYKNYIPNTYLSGWDTLHPEFNMHSYWKRIVSGAWQYHQGLGAVNTQAHASEIPRVILLMFMSLLLKVSDVRYMYAFLMLILGPLGVYFYTKKVFLSDLHFRASSFGAFCAGIFYLLNLGTLQHFYVPLEMFLTQYGFLGWTFLYSTYFFEHASRKNYALFFISQLCITSQAHTPTLFYTYFFANVLYFGALSLVETTKGHPLGYNLKRFIAVIVTILIVNSFWLLPNMYFLFTRSKEIQESKIHHLFSDEAFLANVAYGTMDNIAKVKGFLFDWGEYVGGGEFGQLLNEWTAYYITTGFEYIGYILFILVLFGVALSLFRHYPYWIGVFLIMAFSTIFMLSINPPLGFLMKHLLELVPLLKEILRFPFTKFSILLMFSYSVFFGSFWGFFANIFDKLSSKFFLRKSIYFLFIVFVTLSLYLYMKPAFEGNLISSSMKVSIPSRYFEMFDYINSQQDYGRVAHLPIHSFWGWVYYSWNDITKIGYQGAGFLWFGIQRPLIDREFDRWNIMNEQVYRELSYAIYTKDNILLESTLEKYQIRWLLLDESILAPGYENTGLFIPEILDLFKTSSNISLDKDFGHGLLLYKYSPKKDFSAVAYNVPYTRVGNAFFREYVDPFYSKYGNYVYSSETKFPLIGVTGKDEELSKSILFSDDDYLYVGITSVAELEYPSPLRKLSKNFVESLSDENIFRIGSNFYSKKGLKDSAFTYTEGSGFTTFSEDLIYTLDLYPVLEACSTALPNAYYSMERLSSGFTLKARNVRACVTAPLSSFSQLLSRPSNLFVLSATNLSSRDFCIYDTDSNLCVNFLLNNKIYAYLEKSLEKYSIRIISDSSATPFDKVTTIQGLKAGWGVEGNSVDISTVSLPFEYKDNIRINKDMRYSSFVTELSNDPRLCDFSSGDLGDFTVTYTSKGIVYTSPKQSLCDSFYFHTLAHNTGYLVEIRSKNIAGEPLRVCLTDETTKRCDVYFSLPFNRDSLANYYLLPPFGEGFGYTFNVSNMVFGRTKTVNELDYISFTPIDYASFRDIHLGSTKNLTQRDNLFVYNQAFDSGWVAICNRELCDAEHVTVNNWANGWIFKGPVPDDIKVIFWPQYLEYLGFLLLLIPLITYTKGFYHHKHLL